MNEFRGIMLVILTWAIIIIGCTFFFVLSFHGDTVERLDRIEKIVDVLP